MRTAPAAECEEREANRCVVAGMGDRELVADGDPDQLEHDQRQGPRGPQPDGTRVIGDLDSLDTERLGPPEEADEEQIATEISRLANISPTNSPRTGGRSDSSQFAPHAGSGCPGRDKRQWSRLVCGQGMSLA